MKWYVGYRVGSSYRSKYVKADDANTAIKRARVKDFRELYPVHENLAREMISCVDHVTCEGDPRGTGYFDLEVYTLYKGSEDEVNLIVYCDLCKYVDDTDGHEYFGVYYAGEIDGGDNIVDHDWEYTKDTSLTSLIQALQNISDTLSYDVMKKAYEAA